MPNDQNTPGAAASQPQDSQQEPQAQPEAVNRAAAQARREEKQKRKALEEQLQAGQKSQQELRDELRELRELIQASQQQSQQKHTTDEDLSDPQKLLGTIEERTKKVRDEVMSEVEKREAQTRMRQTEEKIKGRFKVFSDEQTQEAANDLLYGRISRLVQQGDEVDEEVFTEACDSVAKVLERQQAADSQAAGAAGQDDAPPPPSANPAGAQGVNTSGFDEKLDPEERKRRVLARLEQRSSAG